MRLTKHFIDRWQRRVGGYPTLDQVMAILRRSICVQPQSVFRCADGTMYSTLCIYWDPEGKIIIKTDPQNGTIVTVFTKEMNVL